MSPLRLFLTCARGTEAALQQECARLNVDITLGRGGGYVVGTQEDAYRLCLWSRVATRVLLVLEEQPVDDADAFYEVAHSIPWESLFPGTTRFAVTVTGKHQAFQNDRFAVQRCKDAICDRFRARCGSRPDVDRSDPDLRVAVFLGTPTSISLELAGGMHRRGVRARAHAEAPLRESLAAALLELAGHEGDIPVVDPFCGSGTLILEAALRRHRIAPGTLRPKHGFEHWSEHDGEMWQKLREEAHSVRETPENVLFYASDISKSAVESLRRSAKTLGVAASVQSEVTTFENAPQPAAPGLLVTNPPYGVRVGQERELIPLYERLGDTLKQRFSGYQAWLLLGNPELGKHLGLRAERRLQVFNGPIECRYVNLPLYAGSRRAATKPSAEVVTTPAGEPQAPTYRRPSAEAEMFRNRLKKNARRLSGWAKSEAVDAYRIYDADIPEYNLRVERYGSQVRVEEISPPKSVARDVADKRLKDALQIVADTLDVASDNVVLRVRARRDRSSQDRPREKSGARLVVQEGTFSFLVNLKDYLDTGLYLEDRKLRRLLFRESAGKRVLNLFCYTGAASVAAALGTAREVTSVDLSQTYLDWARDNFSQNAIDPTKHRFIKDDAVTWLRQAATRNARYDLIYAGPPTFSTSSGRADFDVQRDHPMLIELASSLLTTGGKLLFFTHARQFVLAPISSAVQCAPVPQMAPRDCPRSTLTVLQAIRR